LRGDREGVGGPYAPILAIARLVKSTVRQFESLCEPFIHCLPRPPLIAISLSLSLSLSLDASTPGAKGEKTHARSDEERGAEILAEAVILMRAVLKFYAAPPAVPRLHCSVLNALD